MDVKTLEISILVDIPNSLEDNYDPIIQRDMLVDGILLMLDGVTAPLTDGYMRMFMSTHWVEEDEANE